MTVAEWLAAALGHAESHHRASDLRPILEGLGAAMAALRAAPWNADASDAVAPPPAPHV